MRASFTAVRKILLRGRALGIPCLAYFALLLGYTIYQVLNYIKFRPINPALYLGSVEMTLYIALAGYAFFLYLGYELGVRLRESQLQEAVRPLPGAACGYMGAAMLHMALLAGGGMAVIMAANGLLYHLGRAAGRGTAGPSDDGLCLVFIPDANGRGLDGPGAGASWDAPAGSLPLGDAADPADNRIPRPLFAHPL